MTVEELGLVVSKLLQNGIQTHEVFLKDPYGRLHSIADFYFDASIGAPVVMPPKETLWRRSWLPVDRPFSP